MNKTAMIANADPHTNVVVAAFAATTGPRKDVVATLTSIGVVVVMVVVVVVVVVVVLAVVFDVAVVVSVAAWLLL